MDLATSPGSPTVQSSGHPPRRYRLTREQFAAMGEFATNGKRVRVELIHGEVIEMGPQNKKHADAVTALNELVSASLARRKLVRVQLPLAVRSDCEPEPDLAVVPRETRQLADHPSTALLVIEVADSSLDYDRTVKLALYAAAGVPEYWIVDVNACCVEVYTEPVGSAYAAKWTARTGDRIACGSVEGLAVEVAEVFS